MTKNKTILLLALLTGAVLLLTPFSLISYIIMVGLGGLLLQSILHRNIGTFTALAFSFLILTCVQQLVGLGFWITDIRFSSWVFIGLVLLFESIYIFKIPSVTVKLRTNRAEIFSVVITVLSVAILAVGLLRGGSLEEQMTRFITRGFDSSTHLSLIMTTYDNEGYVYGPANDINKDIVFSALGGYPQGWHLITSSIWHTIDGSLSFNNLLPLLILFFATAIVWYALLLFVLTRLTAELVMYINNNRPRPFLLFAGLGAISFLLQITMLLSLLRYGFVNYMPLIAYIATIFFLGVLLYTKQINRLPFLVLGSLLITGAMMTWLLATPIAICLMLLPLLATYTKSDLSLGGRFDMKHIISYILISLFAAGSLLQLYLQIKYATVPNNISATTIIWSANNLLLVSLVTAVMLYSASSHTRKHIYPAGILYSSLAILILPAFLYLYLHVLDGKTGYYYEKVAAIVTIMFVVLAGSIAVAHADRFAKKQGSLAAIALILIVALSMPMLFKIDAKELKFAAGKDWTTSNGTAALLANLSRKNITQRDSVYVVEEKDYEEDVIGTHYLNAVSQQESACSSALGWLQIIRQKDSFIKKAKECSTEDGRKYYLISGKENNQFWKNAFIDTPAVTVLVSKD